MFDLPLHDDVFVFDSPVVYEEFLVANFIAKNSLFKLLVLTVIHVIEWEKILRRLNVCTAINFSLVVIFCAFALRKEEKITLKNHKR